MQSSANTIDHGSLRRLVDAGARVDAEVIGAAGGWGVVINCGPVSQTLLATRGQPRTWRQFETLAGYLSPSPRTSASPLMSRPSEITITWTSSGAASVCANSAPAAALSAAVTAAVAARTSVCSNRTAVATTSASNTSVPQICPAVEQPMIAALGQHSARAGPSPGLAMLTRSPNTNTSWASRSAWKADQPALADQRACCTFTPDTLSQVIPE